MYLVLPENCFHFFRFTPTSSSGEPSISTGKLYFRDPPGLPTQHSQGPSRMVRGNRPDTFNDEPVDAAYMIVQPAVRKPRLTVDFFDSQILAESSKYALSKDFSGGSMQWCVSALNALEREGAVAQGETKLLADWLRQKSPELAVKSIYFMKVKGSWDLFLVMPGNCFRRFSTRALDTADPRLAWSLGQFSDPPNLPTQQDPPRRLIYYSWDQWIGWTVYSDIVAGYLITDGVRPRFTVDFFLSEILSKSGKHKLVDRACGGKIEWCIAVLDALEMEGAIAKGETTLFVDWLSKKSAELSHNQQGPKIHLPPNFVDLVKRLNSSQEAAGLDLPRDNRERFADRQQ